MFCPKTLDASCRLPSKTPVAVRREIPLCGWAAGTWSLNPYKIDRRTFKEILNDLLNLSHESIGALQLAVVSGQAETETNG